MEVRPWARVVGDINVRLRRGAWYEVIRLTPDAAILEVDQRSLSIPRTAVQIVTTRPRAWAVVPRPYDAVDIPISWGSYYGVCPRCRGRAQLQPRATEMRCPHCEDTFPLRLT
jgi:hypothetical protein